MHTLTDVSKILDIRIERLREWVNKEFIEPEMKAEGKGYKNLFSDWDILEIKFFSNLVERGFSRKEASIQYYSLKQMASLHTFCADYGDEEYSEKHHGIKYVAIYRINRIDGDTHMETFNEADDIEGIDLIDLHPNFDEIFVFNIGKLKKEVEAKINSYKR